MSDYKVSELYIYPVKSLGGISIPQAEITERGFKYDRRWMLVDKDGQFLSQRTHPSMALLQPSIADDYLKIIHKSDKELQLNMPLDIDTYSDSKLIEVYMWDESIDVAGCGKEYSEWLSDVLKTECRLVCMPDKSIRSVDNRFAHNKEITSLSDGYPFLIIGEESLNLFNSKLDEPLPMNRFRPNVVFSGGQPHDEDNFGKFEIGDVTFEAVKPCSRCSITTVDQDTGERLKEPLKTLSTYRKVKSKIMFGQNLLHSGSGIVSVGDSIVLKH